MKFSLLMVDDDADFRERLARDLTARGLEVTPCGNAMEAMGAVVRPFDGAVVDLRLPDGSGLKVVEALRAAQPSAAIVVLTDFASVASALEAVRHGATDYLTKPVDPDQVLAALRGERLLVGTNPVAAIKVPSLDRVEWEHIQRVLSECDGNISKTARLLGIDRRSLQRKLSKHPPSR